MLDSDRLDTSLYLSYLLSTGLPLVDCPIVISSVSYLSPLFPVVLFTLYSLYICFPTIIMGNHCEMAHYHTTIYSYFRYLLRQFPHPSGIILFS